MLHRVLHSSKRGGIHSLQVLRNQKHIISWLHFTNKRALQSSLCQLMQRQQVVLVLNYCWTCLVWKWIIMKNYHQVTILCIGSSLTMFPLFIYTSDMVYEIVCVVHVDWYIAYSAKVHITQNRELCKLMTGDLVCDRVLGSPLILVSAINGFWVQC